MEAKREFTDLENANAIINGKEDCIDEFVTAFTDLHSEPLTSDYMYDWLIRSLVDIIKINQSVLYVACGTGGYTRLFKNIKRFVGIDFSKKMISTASQLKEKRKDIDFEFQCITFEKFKSDEKFDIIFLGPYGHYVPYTMEVLEKCKEYIKPDGFIFCTITDVEFKNNYQRLKEFVKQLLINKSLDYDPYKKLEKMLKKANLKIWVKLHMKTSIGYSYCYIVRKDVR